MSKTILLLLFGFLFVLGLNTVKTSGIGKEKGYSDSDLLTGASHVGNAIKHNQGLSKYKDSYVSRFIEKAVDKGIAIFKENPLGYGVIFGIFSVINTVSNSLSLVVVQKSKLMSVQFERADLEMLMNAEIIPILRMTDEILQKGATGRGMRLFCEGRRFFFQQLENKINTLRVKRKEVEHDLIEMSKNKGLVAGIAKKIFGDGEEAKVKESLHYIQSNTMRAEASLRTARSNIDSACTLFLLMKREPEMVEWLKDNVADLQESAISSLTSMPTRMVEGLKDSTAHLQDYLANLTSRVTSGVKSMRSNTSMTKDEL